MSRYLGRVRSAFLAASAAALLAACGPAPQRVATGVPNSTTPPHRVSTPAAVPAARLAPPAPIRAAAGAAFTLLRAPGEHVSGTSWAVASIRGDTALATLVMGHP